MTLDGMALTQRMPFGNMKLRAVPWDRTDGKAGVEAAPSGLVPAGPLPTEKAEDVANEALSMLNWWEGADLGGTVFEVTPPPLGSIEME